MATTIQANNSRFHLLLILRLSALCLLFLIQFEVLEIALRSFYDGSKISVSVWAPIQGSQRYIFSYVFVFIAAFVAASGVGLKSIGSELARTCEHYAWQGRLVAQMFAYAGFAYLTYLLSVKQQELADIVPLMLVAWMILLLTTACLSCLALAPSRFWRNVIRSERKSILLAGVVGIAAIAVTWVLTQSWPSMVTMTLRFSESLLRLVYYDVVSRPAEGILGTTGFEVEVTPACAGYEGIGLIIVFLSVFLWMFRDSLRFPAVLLMFPVGILAMWLFNGLRIAALVAIGTSYSQEIAIAGFHSNAGWIAFILVALGLIGLMNRVPVFSVIEHYQAGDASEALKLPGALLIPLIVLLASTLLVSSVSSGFEWLYPLKVIATGSALLYYWKAYEFHNARISIEPVLIGIAVFAVWLFLVPVSSEKTAIIHSHLSNTTPLIAGLWLFFRLVGSAIVVPFAEELAFRGYLLSRMSGANLHTSVKFTFTWLPFLGSSLLFGLVHGAWLAGTAAGMCYAIARYRHGRLSDSILAHMTTNTMLSVYVIATQEWSYW